MSPLVDPKRRLASQADVGWRSVKSLLPGITQNNTANGVSESLHSISAAVYHLLPSLNTSDSLQSEVPSVFKMTTAGSSSRHGEVF